MDTNQALNVLIQAVNVAQKRGAYNLQEASTISNAVSVFVTEPSSEIETTDEEAIEKIDKEA